MPLEMHRVDVHASSDAWQTRDVVASNFRPSWCRLCMVIQFDSLGSLTTRSLGHACANVLRGP